MTLEKSSPCKVNLLLNILGKRPDGFHELETVMHPVNVFDHLTFTRADAGVDLTCNDPTLPTDSRNLVHRAATIFFEQTDIKAGAKIVLEKNLPLAAGLGGGSGNAATTLLGLNELFQFPLSTDELHPLAARLGSDIPFFLQTQPALATGRGEKIEALEPFAALHGKAFLLIHPGFGISTAWAYQTLAQYPSALNGSPGRAGRLIELLANSNLKTAAGQFYNSLEAPALHKYPLLAVFQEFLREHGALAALMSGSGSTTFAITENLASAESLADRIKGEFGSTCWTAAVPV